MCDHLNLTSDKPGIQVSDSFRDWSRWIFDILTLSSSDMDVDDIYIK